MIAAIMPCRGRTEQTIANVKRLLAMAGRVEWQLICMVDSDHTTHTALVEAKQPIWVAANNFGGYWSCLSAAFAQWPEFPLIVNLANDLLPGRDWLERCYGAYRARFGEGGDGLMGFNDGLHGPELSPHFLISRRLLDRYGGWPVHYQHNYGDTELCLRALQDSCYGKAAWAVLYHNHPFMGASEDSVYSEGQASFNQDRALFYERRERGWR